MAPGKKKKPTATELVKDIKHRTRRVFSADNNWNIVNKVQYKKASRLKI
jgi:hypothetical protein